MMYAWISNTLITPELGNRCIRCRTRAGPLQARKGLWFPQDKGPDNTTLCPIAFTSKSLTSTERRSCNIGREALGIFHGPEKFHHYCFTYEVGIISDHKPLVVTSKKDVATL